MIKVPKGFSYIEAYITLRCNLACPYCINQHTGVTRKRNELTPREWCLGLNNIDTDGLPITFGGGEPLFYSGFYEILAGLRSDLKIDILTNGMSFDVHEFMARIPAERLSSTKPQYKSIRISYHPASTNVDKVLDVAARLDRAGYSVGIFGLNHPNNLSKNVAMAESCKKAGVYFFIRDFLGYYDDRLYGYYRYHSALNGNRKKCLCKNEELLIGPEGDIYRCHRDLYDGSCEIGNILNMAFELNNGFRPCANYGLCNPCDIKLKLSPDLKLGKCSIEVEVE